MPNCCFFASWASSDQIKIIVESYGWKWKESGSNLVLFKNAGWMAIPSVGFGQQKCGTYVELLNRGTAG